MAPSRVGIISGCDTSSARLPAEDAAKAVTRIDAVAIVAHVNVGTPSTCSFVHAVHRSVTVTRHICCAACKEATTQNKPYIGTRSLHLRRSSAPASAPKQIVSSNAQPFVAVERLHIGYANHSYALAETDLIVRTRSPRQGPPGRGALPHARPSGKVTGGYSSLLSLNVNGSLPTLKHRRQI